MAPPLKFPSIDAAGLRDGLRQWFCRPDARLDTEAAADWLGVNASTLRRWVRGRARIPRAVQMLVHLVAEGVAPGLYPGWAGWAFRDRTGPRGERETVLVDDNGEIWTPATLRTLRFDLACTQRRLARVEREVDVGLTLQEQAALAAASKAIERARAAIDWIQNRERPPSSRSMNLAQ